MQYANGLISVTDTFMNWALKYAQRDKNNNDKVFSLGYKKLKMQEDKSHISDRFFDIEKKIKEKFIVFFVGTFSRSYHNPAILLEVAGKMKDHSDIHFVIAGDGELFNEIKIASEKHSNVTLTGWLNRQEIEFWLKRSKTGVCPSSAPIDLPTNKAYAYLSAGLPVITAFEGELKEAVTKYQAGFYYPPNNVSELKNCIIKLYEDNTLYRKMSVNAQNLFDKFFDADKIYEEYAGHIEKLAKN